MLTFALCFPWGRELAAIIDRRMGSTSALKLSAVYFGFVDERGGATRCAVAAHRRRPPKRGAASSTGGILVRHASHSRAAAAVLPAEASDSALFESRGSCSILMRAAIIESHIIEFARHADEVSSSRESPSLDKARALALRRMQIPNLTPRRTF